MAVPLADLGQQARQPLHVGRHLAGHDVLLAGAHQVRPRLWLTRERVVQRGQRLLVVGVDEQAIRARDEVVTGGALHGKGVAQPLVVGEDLLDRDVRVGRGLAQREQVADRVAQAVDVVDTQPADGAVADVLEDQPVAVLEHRLKLGPQADEGVDGEEPPVVELLLRRAPVREPVVLAL